MSLLHEERRKHQGSNVESPAKVGQKPAAERGGRSGPPSSPGEEKKIDEERTTELGGRREKSSTRRNDGMAAVGRVSTEEDPYEEVPCTD